MNERIQRLRDETLAGRLTPEQAESLSRESLRVLVPSGLQEHEEELGVSLILKPAEVLEQVHVRKTGLLFEAPLAVRSERCVPVSNGRDVEFAE